MHMKPEYINRFPDVYCTCRLSPSTHHPLWLKIRSPWFLVYFFYLNGSMEYKLYMTSEEIWRENRASALWSLKINPPLKFIKDCNLLWKVWWIWEGWDQKLYLDTTGWIRLTGRLGKSVLWCVVAKKIINPIFCGTALFTKLTRNHIQQSTNMVKLGRANHI